MAHLYTAARKYGLITRPWQDMDLVLSAHQLVPKTSKGGDQFTILRHYLMCISAPATEFSRGRVPNLPAEQEILKRARALGVTSEYSRTMLETVRAHQSTGTSDTYLLAHGNIPDIVLRQILARPNKNSPNKGGQTKPQFSQVDLLAAYKRMLIADEPHLNFSYLAFWRSCFNQMAHIGQTVFKKFPEKKLQETATGLVHGILDDAAKVASSPALLRASPMGSAALLLDEFIALYGNKYSNKSFCKSSGRIPKSLHPKLEPWDRDDEYADSPMESLKVPISTLGFQVAKGPSGGCLFAEDGSEELFNAFKGASEKACTYGLGIGFNIADIFIIPASSLDDKDVEVLYFEAMARNMA